jgi:hypothetical protein
MKFPKIDTKSRFYKNCLRNRRNGAKICKVCPFRAGIEAQERARMKAARKRLGRMIQSKVAKILMTPNPILNDILTEGAADLDECLGRMGVERGKSVTRSIAEEACEPRPVKRRRRKVDPTKPRRIHVGGISVPHIWR